MKITLVFLFPLFVTYYSQAQVHPNSVHLNTSKGLAIEGYDPVAYFFEQEAVPGKEEIFTVFQGVTYRFRSTGNKAAFEKNPSKYLPQYGGWCAYAMGASGEKVDVDPETFKIKNGKLYLFYNRFFNNTLTKWNSDEAALEVQANRNWNKIANSHPTQN